MLLNADQAHLAGVIGIAGALELAAFGGLAGNALAQLALDPHARIDLTTSYWSDLVARVAPPYFAGLSLQVMTFDTLPGGVDAFNNEAIILIHPLWDTDAANFRPEVAAAVADGR